MNKIKSKKRHIIELGTNMVMIIWALISLSIYKDKTCLVIVGFFTLASYFLIKGLYDLRIKA